MIQKPFYMAVLPRQTCFVTGEACGEKGTVYYEKSRKNQEYERNADKYVT